MKERKTKRTNKKGKKISFNDRAGFIVNAFREMPDAAAKYLSVNRFSGISRNAFTINPARSLNEIFLLFLFVRFVFLSFILFSFFELLTLSRRRQIKGY